MSKDAERMMALFAGFSSAHGTHGVPRRAVDELKWEIRSTAKTLREPVTVELWRLHLAGKRPLGVITIREDGLCRWGSIDFDVYDTNLLEIIQRVEKAKLPLVPCRSKSGGLHLFLFLKEWTPAGSIQAVLRDMAAQLGVAGSEIFPKQVEILADRGDLGSWMVMPYFGDTFGGKIQEQVGLKRAGTEMSMNEFMHTAEEKAVTADELSKITRKRSTSSGHAAPRGNNGRAPSSDPDQPFGDGPPCLETMAAEKVQKGGQNNALLQMGIYYKRRDPSNWEDQLEAANREFLDPPGNSEGLASVKRSLNKREYNYLCKTEPMCSFCNVSICRTRAYGVGDEGDYPMVSGLTKLLSDPPLWFMDVNGKRVELTTQELVNYPLFQQKVLDQANAYFNPMSQKDWTLVIKAAVSNLVPVEVPPDAGERGRFHELLEEFLTNKMAGETLEDLFSGRPFFNQDERRYYFRLRDLQNHLMREGIKDLTRGRITERIRNLKGKDEYFNLKGKGLRCWYVPADVVEPTPELSTPRKRESGI